MRLIQTIGSKVCIATVLIMLGCSARAAETDDYPLLVLIINPVQETVGGPNYLRKPGANWISDLADALPLAELVVIGGVSSAITYFGGDSALLKDGVKTARHSFNFENSVKTAVSSIESGAQWYSVGQNMLEFDGETESNARHISERVFKQGLVKYAVFFKFEFFTTPNLDQLRLHVRCTVYEDSKESARSREVMTRHFEYVSVSQGEIMRPWHAGEKDALIARIESEYESKMERYPQNKKAYAKDRKTALGALWGREVVLPTTAVSEGWPGDSMGAALQLATNTMAHVLRDDLATFSPREKSDSERVQFLAFNDKGSKKSYKGRLVSTLGAHDIYRRADGDTFILPRE